MRCPFCGEDNDKVVDSRSSGEGAVTRRRRECLACGKRFTTYERVEEAPLRVIKNDGGRVGYDRKKVAKGILLACEKRPVSQEAVDGMVADIEEAITNAYDREVPASFIGEEIMNRLKSLDEVAYVRFASVYRRFEAASDFASTIEEVSEEVSE